MSNALSTHDFTMLDVAVRRVSQFDISHAKSIWNVSTIATKRRLAKLERRGLVKSRNVLASLSPLITKPLCHWAPNTPLPHAGQVSYAARTRWKSLPVEIRRVYYATNLGRGLLGRAAISPPKDIQATHDLGLSATFVEYLKRWPKLTKASWLNESEYAMHRGRHVKVEDAVLSRNGCVLQMIDFAGAYRPDRVQDLLDHAHQYQTPIAIY